MTVTTTGAGSLLAPLMAAVACLLARAASLALCLAESCAERVKSAGKQVLAAGSSLPSSEEVGALVALRVAGRKVREARARPLRRRCEGARHLLGATVVSASEAEGNWTS